ncbi:Lrp/AsnC family transcriptional regulator [Modestobacter sp. Leaf380]|uniref:Lrp/AsnC family transcriptional regulator n=1 Tax=Modestobacter sp. Leaf380 TaxID=1736356 RepID=UPI0006F51CAD|nr:Lrp/AsnC family transcriptional regulator [Modestobacter sp. Leaf380]KQS71343.1 AsnC family transcriptional regulator [Modestobacter sp. Leaf380]
MHSIDATDARLLLALDDDPQASAMALSTRLGLARNTVHARLRRLEDGGTLGAHSRRLDTAALGRGLLAFMTLSLSQSEGSQATAALAAIPEIVEVLATTGEGDLLVRVVAVDTADLYRVTEAVLAAPGVVRASTSIALVEVVPFRLAPLLHERADR